MGIETFLVMIVIGALAGWGAGKLMGSSLPLIWNIVLGIAGGVLGGALLGRINLFTNGWLNYGVTALAGACLILFIVRLLKK